MHVKFYPIHFCSVTKCSRLFKDQADMLPGIYVPRAFLEMLNAEIEYHTFFAFNIQEKIPSELVKAA